MPQTFSLLNNGYTIAGAGGIVAQSIPGFATRKASFDQYKIYKVKIVFEGPKVLTPSAYESGGGGTYTGISSVKHYAAIDFTDTTAPVIGDLPSFVTSAAAKHAPLNKDIKLIFRPRILQRAYEGPTSDAYLPTPPRWIDCDDDGVAHLGWKWIVDNTSFTGDGSDSMFFKIRYTVYYGLKNINKPGNT